MAYKLVRPGRSRINVSKSRLGKYTRAVAGVVRPGQVVNVVSGDTVRFLSGVHTPAQIRVPVNNVRFEFEKSVVLNGQRTVGNAFYLNGGDDTKLVALDLTSKPQFRNYAKTVVYASAADRFLMKGICTVDSGSDTGDSFLDHGIYIDGCVGFVVEDHVSEKITGHGIQIYSGSGRVTTGRITRARLFGNRGDGLHVGNAATNCVASEVEAFGNGHWGVRFYAGVGTRMPGPNWLYGNANGAFRVDRMSAQPTVLEWVGYAPETSPPPPPPDPEPDPDPDPCQAIKDELAAVKVDLESVTAAGVNLTAEVARLTEVLNLALTEQRDAETALAARTAELDKTNLLLDEIAAAVSRR